MTTVASSLSPVFQCCLGYFSRDCDNNAYLMRSKVFLRELHGEACVDIEEEATRQRL
jgi:hypothetical protein